MMKTLLFALLMMPISFGFEADFNQIVKAISSGDAQTLGQYFDNSVEVVVLDEENLYDKNQAIKLVSNFFAKHQPSSFSQVHQGSSKGNDSKYYIGSLTTNNGNFRVYIYMKVDGDKYLIQELRFDEA